MTDKIPEYIKEFHDLYQLRIKQEPEKVVEYAEQLAKQITDLIK